MYTPRPWAETSAMLNSIVILPVSWIGPRTLTLWVCWGERGPVHRRCDSLLPQPALPFVAHSLSSPSRGAFNAPSHETQAIHSECAHHELGVCSQCQSSVESCFPGFPSSGADRQTADRKPDAVPGVDNTSKCVQGVLCDGVGIWRRWR